MSTTSRSAHWLHLIRSNIGSVYLFILVCVTVVLGLALHPSLALLPSATHPSPQAVLESGDISIKEFWEARERHTDGSFQMNLDAITQRQTFRLVAVPGTEAPIFTFESDTVQSSSYLISTQSAQAIRQGWEASDGRVNDDVWILERDGTYSLQWLRSSEQMQEVVGFFDYVEEERELLKDRVWYGVATVAGKINRK